MNNLFHVDRAVVVPSTLARVFGLLEAAILQEIYHAQWTDGHNRNGVMWVYGSVGFWAQRVPYVSRATIGRKLKGLTDGGFLVARNFNPKGARDVTLSYAIDNDKIEAEVQSWLAAQSQQQDTPTPMPEPDIEEENEQWWEEPDVAEPGTPLGTEPVPEPENIFKTYLMNWRDGKLPVTLEEGNWRIAMGLTAASQVAAPVIDTARQAWPTQQAAGLPQGVMPEMFPPNEMEGTLPPMGSTQEAGLLFGKICQLIGLDIAMVEDQRRRQVNQLVRAMQEAGYAYGDLVTWWRTIWLTSWPGNTGQRPTVSQMRDSLGLLGQVRTDRAQASNRFKQWFIKNMAL